MASNVQEAIQVERDIVFGKGGDTELRLDVYYSPPGTSKRTAVINLYGGGFQRGAKENVEARCRAFAERGYTSIAPTYRLVDVDTFPAQIEDVKAAIRWTRANVERLGVESDKIAVAGYSAGAQLALIACGNDADLEGSGGSAGVSSAVNACIAFYPLDVTPPGHQLMAADANAEAYRLSSPMTYARAGAPPTILLHATGDVTLPFEGSVNLFNAFRAAGVPAELHLFEGLSHAFDRHPEFLASAVEVCDLFLDRHVVEPRVYPPFVSGAARPG
ncbi:MAG TPA: alpha/beta hydrolase [Dehalococcoidia bacterium]|jgi:acetyl esterase/lipase|nr:alpha/beta hydrolase [Dehalococcoidia bacterium]